MLNEILVTINFIAIHILIYVTRQELKLTKKVKPTKKDLDKAIIFTTIRPKLIDMTKEIARKSNIKEEITLVDGFVKQEFSLLLTPKFMLGGPVIPMVMFLGNQSGQIYYFALKSLMDIDF